MYFYIYLSLSAIAAVLCALFCFPISMLWIAIPLFAGLFVIFFVLHYCVAVLLTLFVCPPNKKSNKYHPRMRLLMVDSVDFLNRLAGVRLHVSGKEKVPENEPFTFVCNHLSRFDPMVSMCAFRSRPLAFVSKPENFKIPFAGRFMRVCRYIAIDREDPIKAMNAINECVSLLREGVQSIGVYPEGTRSKDGKLHEFKNGVFLIPKKAHTPIVVARLRGTDQIKNNFPFRHTDVYLDILESVPYDEIAKMRTNSIGDMVYATMLDAQEKTDK